MCKKYLRAYYNLVNKAFLQKRNKKDGYYEGHHVKLNCFGGKRIVLLTAREHYIAHFLIYKHHKSNKNKNKMIKCSYAWNQMTWHSPDNITRYNSHTYDYARKEFSKNISGENHPFFGKQHSEESRLKISDSLLNMEKSKRDEMIRKQVIAAKNRKSQTEETKNKRASKIKEFHKNKDAQFKIVLPNGEYYYHTTLRSIVHTHNLSRSMLLNAKDGEKIKTSSKIKTDKIFNTINCIIYKLKGEK